MSDIPSILYSTMPLLYGTGNKEYPHAYAGSCFPVKWDETLYIVSAFHCFENHGVNPEDTLYLIPNCGNRCFSFVNKLRATIEESNDLKHYDQILLEVSADVHSKEQLSSVLALDLSDSNSVISLSADNIKDVWLRGYLSENPNHNIDYEQKKIMHQAYVTNGMISKRSSVSNYCFCMRVTNPTLNGISADGMSGSAVYAVDDQSRVHLAGVVIEYNNLTNEYLVIDASVIRELLRKANT